MFRSFRSTRFLAAFVLMLAVAAVSFADTLRLKDGSILKGRIVSFGNGKFTIVVGEGTRQRQMTFDADEVDSIQFDSTLARTDTTAAQDKRNPEFIPTSAPPKNVPRVVTTDTIGAKQQQQPRSEPVPVRQEPVQTRSEPAVAVTSRPAIGAKPIEVSVKVLADNTANGWTNSGFVVRKGQKVRVIGGGNVSLGGGRSTGPSGLYDVDDQSKLLKSVPTGALIAVIGDDNNEFIYIGSERTFTATRDGALFLGVNEGNLDDNSGAFEVRIEIQPA